MSIENFDAKFVFDDNLTSLLTRHRPFSHFGVQIEIAVVVVVEQVVGSLKKRVRIRGDKSWTKNRAHKLIIFIFYRCWRQKAFFSWLNFIWDDFFSVLLTLVLVAKLISGFVSHVIYDIIMRNPPNLPL